MKWNEAAGECQVSTKTNLKIKTIFQQIIFQMFLDVDCSGVTYETPPSKLILDVSHQMPFF